MNATRKSLRLLLAALALGFCWKNLSRAGQEVVVLHMRGVRHEDRFATLWVVDDGRYTWIRAENRKRRWLSYVRENPDVELRRQNRTFRYRAKFFDTAAGRAYVDPKFREKYGFADWLRKQLGDRDTLPIRLEPR